MSKIEELRSSEKNQLNLIKIFEKLFPEKKTKYYELLSRFVAEHFDMVLKRKSNINRLESFNVNELNDLEKVFILFFTAKIMSLDEIERFEYFCEKHDTNVIKADLQKLEYSEISQLCEEAQSNEELKKLQNQYIKLYSDDEWFVILPLSYESSVKYGYGAKWCTASEDTDENFFNYTNDGVLIYIINRKKNLKFAIYQEKDSLSETNSNITLWDAEDKCIELFFTTDIPESVLSPIRNFLIENDETNATMYDRLYNQNDEKVEIEDDESEYDNDEDLEDLGDKDEDEDEDEDEETDDTNDDIANFSKIINSNGYYYEEKRAYSSPFWDAVRRVNKF